MKSTFARILLAIAVTFTFSAFAQTGSAATPNTAAALPAAPSAAGVTTTTPVPNTGTKVGAINIEGAIFNSNEGRRDMEALSNKFQPKQAELKAQYDELEALKKQLSTQGEHLNDDAKTSLQKQIDTKQKSFDRAGQDAQEDFQNQQQEVAGRILQKMAPVIVKYAQENGFGMVIDTSKPWPQSPILMAGEGVDITKQVVDIYNTQSGVPAPTTSGAAKPAAPKAPGSATPKPTTPKPSEPKQ